MHHKIWSISKMDSHQQRRWTFSKEMQHKIWQVIRRHLAKEKAKALEDKACKGRSQTMLSHNHKTSQTKQTATK